MASALHNAELVDHANVHFFVEGVCTASPHLQILACNHFVLEGQLLLSALVVDYEALVGGGVHAIVAPGSREFKRIDVLWHSGPKYFHLRPHMGIVF